ncbi:MAG: hypothetical protein CML65_14760 [Rhodobacteraceae bacterium]|nr:hypothetical protein [Paracoccaceae bacterium]
MPSVPETETPDTTVRRVPVEEARAAAKGRRRGKPARRRPHLRRVLWRHGCRVTLLGAFCVLLMVMFIGQTLSAPPWLRELVSARIELAMPGYKVDFGNVHFVIRKGWRPRVGVSDLRISDDGGRPILELSSAEASLAMRPLLRGKVNPKKITLSGARIALRRNADGAVALDVGESGRFVEEAEDLPKLIEGWEDRLLTDPLTALTEFELTGVTLTYDDLASGRSWTVDDGRLELTRHGDRLSISAGLNVLSGRSYAATLEASYDSSIPTRAATFGIQVTDMAAQDIALQTPALGWLEPLRAPISGSLRGGIGADGAVLPLNATLRIGAGALQPTDATRPIPFRGARAYVSFDPKEELLTFDELWLDSAWGKGTVEGRASISGLEEGRLDALVGQFSANNLTLNPAGVYDEPLTLSGAHADFRLRLHPFELTLGEALIRDGDDPIRLDGMVQATDAGWRYALNGRIEEIDATRLLEIWPEAALEKPRDWVHENVLSGRIQDVDVAVRGEPGMADPDVYADFDFDGAEVTFSPNLPPLKGASGQASFVDNRLAAYATTGRIEAEQGGAIDVSGSSFIVPDVRVKPATPAVVRFKANGAPTAVLSLLDRPPLSVLSKANLPVDLAEGHVAVTGTLALPMQKKVDLSDMDFHVNGTVTDVRSDVLVPGHELVGDDLKVFVDNSHVEISGDGQISGIPASFKWTQPIGVEGAGSQVEGRVALSQKAVDVFKLGLPDGSVHGEGQADFALTIGQGSAPRIKLSSDLAGIGLSVPSLGWRMSQGATGSLDVDATLGTQPEVNRVTLSGAGLTMSGRVLTRPGGAFDRAVFDSLRIGSWLNVSAELVSRGVGLAPAVRINGGTLDLQGAQFGEGTGGDSPPLSVSLDRLQIAKGMAVTALNADLTTNGGLSGTFTGRVNGGTPISGKVIPQGARSAFQITASDAGGVFRDAGIIKQAHGGAMSLTLLPAPEDSSYDGTLKVTNTNVKEDSGVGALLNAISLVGLIDELAGKGISFLEVDAKFRLSPTRFTLLSASAIGPSIGVSLDGIYDMVTDRLDMQGVLSPLYALNIIGSVMTRKGEGLIGINFGLQGPASDPKIKVYPLSALAPGFLRELFRDPAPTVSKSRTEGVPLTGPVTGPATGTPQPQQDEVPRVRPLGGEDR